MFESRLVIEGFPKRKLHLHWKIVARYSFENVIMPSCVFSFVFFFLFLHLSIFN